MFVHPTAVIDPGAILGANCQVWHFCHVMIGAILGEGVVLGQGVFVGRQVRVGARTRVQNFVNLVEGVNVEEDVFIGPSVTFTNIKRPRATISQRDAFACTNVGRGATLGAGSIVLPGVEIGPYALVGAGAVVTKDVPAHAEVVGNPARRVGWVSHAGRSLRLVNGHWSCPETGERFIERNNCLEVAHDSAD